MTGSVAVDVRRARRPRFAQARRTVRAVLACWRADLSASAEYRVALVVGTMVTTIWLGISIAPVLILTLHTDGAGGWTISRLLFLQAVWYLLDAVVWVFLANNVGHLEDHVRMGTLDGLLLRPVSSLVMCSVSRLYVPDLPKVVLAVGLGVVAVAMGGGPAGVLGAVGALVATVSALVLMWSLGVLSNYKVLTKVQFDGWTVLFAVHNLARVPIPLYGPVLRVLLTAVVPVAFLATVPAQVFYGDVGAWLALVSAVLAAGAVALTSHLWHRELRHYSGAMS